MKSGAGRGERVMDQSKGESRPRREELKSFYEKALSAYREGTKTSCKEGYDYLKYAALGGYPAAERMFAVLHISGEYDPYPAKDAITAAAWLERAASHEDAEAMHYLSQCYAYGIGVKKDEEKARHWEEEAKLLGYVKDQSEQEEAENEERAPFSESGDSAHEASESSDAAAEGSPARRTESSYEKAVREVVYAEEQALSKYRRSEYLRRCLTNGGILAATVLGISLIGFLAVMNLLDLQGRAAYFLFAGMALMASEVIGWLIGVRQAKLHIEKEEAYRSTPFYERYQMQFSELTEDAAWDYKVYHSLIKAYLPVSDRKCPDAADLEGHSGLLYPLWTYRSGENIGTLDMLIITDKAAYGVRSLPIRGYLFGGIGDDSWTLKRSEKQRRGRKIPNYFTENAEDVALAKEALTAELGVKAMEIPFFNVLVFGPDLSADGLGLMGAESDTVLVQGGPDKLRAYIAARDSRLYAHQVDMESLIRAMGRIGEKQLLEKR